MPNFDFHSNLSSIEFERLIRDILQEKFKGIKFRTYKAGKDGGIDVKSISGNEKIICQAKLYQNSFPQVKRALKDEFKKIKRINPSRYIIATSCSLSNENIIEILEIFKEINLLEEDIWDKERLNHILSSPQYKPVLKNHLKLFLTDLNILEESLKKVINNDVVQFSLAELENINNEIKFYVNTSFVIEASQRLIKEKVMVISSVAGSGKTTTARIIINNLLNIIGPSAEFFKITFIKEAWQSFDSDKQQIFLLDDFWGSFIEEMKEPDVKKSDKLISFLDKIKRSNNHYTIITSRDYIIKHEDIQKQPKLKNAIDNHISIINLPEQSHKEKAHIFIRQLYCSDFDREFISDLYYLDTLETIVKHENFNPRLIHQFIYNIYPASLSWENNNYNRYKFYSKLESYLDNPNEYWEHLLNMQTDTGRLILMILTMSSGNENRESLYITFENCIPIAKDYGIEVKSIDFNNTITLLEDNFINIINHKNSSDFQISFKNGSIGDYLISYLQKNISSWASILLKGAVFFDQLTTIFVANESSTKSLNNKILIPLKNKREYKKKLLGDLLSIPKNVQDLEKEKFFAKEDIVFRLLEIIRIFNIEEDEEVRNFLIQKVSVIIKLQEERGYFPFDRNNLSYLAKLFTKMQGYLNFDKEVFLNSLLCSIYHFEDFEDFIRFSETFKNEYTSYVQNNRKKVRRHFESVLIVRFEDLLEDDEDELEFLIDITYKDILQGLKLKHSPIFEKTIHKYFGIYLRTKPNIKKSSYILKSKNSRKRTKPKRLNKIKKDYWNILQQYAKYEEIEEIESNNIDNILMYHENTLNEIININSNLSRIQIEVFLKSISANLIFNNKKWYTENEIRRTFFKEVIDISLIDFSIILERQEKWYKLRNKEYAQYLIALYSKEDINDDRYNQEIEQILDHVDCHEPKILEYILLIDKERFHQLYLKRYFNDFFSKINFSNTYSLVTSFTDTMKWDVEICFKHYRGKIIDIEIIAEGGGDCVLESLIKILLPERDIELTGLGGDLVFNILNNPELLEEFGTYCKKSIISEKKKRMFHDRTYTAYEIDLSKHLINVDFYEMALKSKWIKELEEIIECLYNYYKSL